MMTIAQAESKDSDSPDADFLEFLAEVEEATGEGFSAWLATDSNADALIPAKLKALNNADGSKTKE